MIPLKDRGTSQGELIWAQQRDVVPALGGVDLHSVYRIIKSRLDYEESPGNVE